MGTESKPKFDRKEYVRRYQREWLKRRREEFFRGKSCAQCGSDQRLELDHIQPEKKVSHRIWGWSKERRKTELAKCQILCRPCHQKKTLRDGSVKVIEHGSSAYRSKRCRCGVCRKAAVIRVNEWRWKTGRRKQRNTALPKGNT